MHPAVLTLEQTILRFAREKRNGRKVVFTNGCFDILHLGHVDYLERARALGDVLVLGLNSDASMRRIGKGDERPLQSEESRSRIMAGRRTATPLS